MAPSSSPDALIPVTEIQQRIHWVRGKRGMLDADLARFYGVTTKRLNEQVRRNQHRFPEDFRFQLTEQEVIAVLRSRSQNATLKRGQNIKYLPHVFTEHGAIMAATVLNSETAVEMSVAIVRAFVQLRELLATHRELAAKLTQLERKLEGHDAAMANLFEAIRQLLGAGESAHRRKIGFHRGGIRSDPGRAEGDPAARLHRLRPCRCGFANRGFAALLAVSIPLVHERAPFSAVEPSPSLDRMPNPRVADVRSGETGSCFHRQL